MAQHVGRLLLLALLVVRQGGIMTKNAFHPTAIRETRAHSATLLQHASARPLAQHGSAADAQTINAPIGTSRMKRTETTPLATGSRSQRGSPSCVPSVAF